MTNNGSLWDIAIALVYLEQRVLWSKIGHKRYIALHSSVQWYPPPRSIARCKASGIHVQARWEVASGDNHSNGVLEPWLLFDSGRRISGQRATSQYTYVPNLRRRGLRLAQFHQQQQESLYGRHRRRAVSHRAEPFCLPATTSSPNLETSARTGGIGNNPSPHVSRLLCFCLT